LTRVHATTKPRGIAARSPRPHFDFIPDIYAERHGGAMPPRVARAFRPRPPSTTGAAVPRCDSRNRYPDRWAGDDFRHPVRCPPFLRRHRWRPIVRQSPQSRRLRLPFPFQRRPRPALRRSILRHSRPIHRIRRCPRDHRHRRSRHCRHPSRRCRPRHRYHSRQRCRLLPHCLQSRRCHPLLPYHSIRRNHSLRPRLPIPRHRPIPRRLRSPPFPRHRPRPPRLRHATVGATRVGE
jgi:hypothetical protein